MIKHVPNFQELVATPFAGGVNALCLKRSLVGDFGAIVGALCANRRQTTDDRCPPTEEGEIVTIDEERLRSLKLGAYGLKAVEVLIEDLRQLRDLGRDPVLNLISGYPRDEDAAVVATDLSAEALAKAEASPRRGGFARDVFSWHVDSAPVEADTWLCTYHGSASEGLHNEDAIRKVDVPEIRAQLLELYHQTNGISPQVYPAISAEPQVSGFRSQVSAFEAWLSENCYDLHYAPKPGAVPYSFGIGNLWRIAVDWPGSAVLPCVHRAPATIVGEPRLMIIC